MFEAICSRTPDQRIITADQAYSLVFNQSDWGATQSRDGWVCPECHQPVFLKPPHERIAKGYSFVVGAHFCHHSTNAAAKCELYRAGGRPSDNLGDPVTSDRRQSLQRFLSGSNISVDYISELLRLEEEFLRDVARELGIHRVEHLRTTKDLWNSPSSESLSVARANAHLDQVDSFLAGVFALGIEHKKLVRNGFLAVRGRKNKLRSMIIDFGRTRKKYFRAVLENGLEAKHASLAKQIASGIAISVDASEDSSTASYYGMPCSIIDTILDKVGLKDPNELPPDYFQYLFLLPLLGSELQGIRLIGAAPVQSDPDLPPAADSPVRITAKGKLLISDSVISSLVREGAKLDGLTSFVRPLPQPAANGYVLVPGQGCLLLTSVRHADPTEPSGYTSICREILEADQELPAMLWNQREAVPSGLYSGTDVLVPKELLQKVIESASKEFNTCYVKSKTGLRYRRIHSGIRIALLSK